MDREGRGRGRGRGGRGRAQNSRPPSQESTLGRGSASQPNAWVQRAAHLQPQSSNVGAGRGSQQQPHSSNAWVAKASQTQTQPQPQPQPQRPSPNVWVERGSRSQTQATNQCNVPEQRQPVKPQCISGQSAIAVQFGSISLSETGSSSSSSKGTPELRSSLSSSKPSDQKTVPLRRPDSGGQKCYKKINLLANFFPVDYDSGLKIWHFDLDIKKVESRNDKRKGKEAKDSQVKGNFSREVSTEIMQTLVKQNSEVFQSNPWVFDGKKNLYSCQGRLAGCYKVSLVGEDGRSKEFDVRITDTGHELSASRLERYLNASDKSHVEMPQDMFQALDLVFRQHPSQNRILIGRSLYSPERSPRLDLRKGITASQGFYMSVRPTAMGLGLNLDLSVVAFHKPIPVFMYLKERCQFDENRRLHPELKRNVEKALKGLKVKVTHRRCSQKYLIKGLTQQNAGEIKFEMDTDNGTQVTESLVSYFTKKYNLKLKYPHLPCLDVSKNKNKQNFIPMEICELCPGQRYSRDYLDTQQQKIFNYIACPPSSDRKSAIINFINSRDGPAGGTYPSGYGLSLDKSMVSVSGRVLEPPELQLGQQKRFTPREDYQRQWNLVKLQVFHGKPVQLWGILVFTDTPNDRLLRSMVSEFGDKLARRCGEIGIQMRPSCSYLELIPMSYLTNPPQLSRLLDTCGKLHIVICVFQCKHHGYNTLKLIAETEKGIVTQCCLLSNVEKYFRVERDGRFSYNERSGSQFMANLGLKINAKLGGSNIALSRQLSAHIPRLGNSTMMFMGADVNHPSPGDRMSPSISAVVGSMDSSHTKYHSRIRYQRHRVEHIAHLDEMVYELLADYGNFNPRLPDKIVFFRDGVSESQFGMALNEELPPLKDAVSRFSNYNPQITFIVAQKRHHTRLFLADEGDTRARGRSGAGNPPPGTVVDTIIVHPRCFDFYICSHNGLKGTSKPTHYTVLYDESAFGSDEVQLFIYHLCYTFARCTKPVSLVTPVYYADLAAYRGRLYYQGSQGDNGSVTSEGSSSSAEVAAGAGPQPHQLLKNSMFFC
eukprot:TRINITY_DN19553_c0_g1_i1.p1 TRINITY_DN19553_c0_g1~~TRINITY_DN19553_c0_g1_i1.p1  ORF type:complete len:1050 (+),score=113.01 TRINITY_DN19553_c0_g1_i1:425-3574(+)